jgi:hypothetical protein
MNFVVLQIGKYQNSKNHVDKLTSACNAVRSVACQQHW